MKKVISIMVVAIMFATSAFAQETENDATLEETMDFISVKTMQKTTIYRSDGRYTYDFFQRFTHMGLLDDKTILFKRNYERCSLDLKNVKQIEVAGNRIVFTGTNQIAKKWDLQDRNNAQTETSNKISIEYNESDIQSVFNAYKHLFKLLEIKLIENKF